jgi:hypothetical protein
MKIENSGIIPLIGGGWGWGGFIYRSFAIAIINLIIFTKGSGFLSGKFTILKSNPN